MMLIIKTKSPHPGTNNQPTSVSLGLSALPVCLIANPKPIRI